MTDQFETERMVMRTISLDDAPGLHRVFTDEITMAYWSDAPSTDLEETRRRVQADIDCEAKGQARFWSVRLRDTGETVGKCTLFHWDEQNRRAEIGYILRRDLWGQGMMSEACEGLLRHAFETLGLHRVEADADVDNAGSIALLEKLGFQREGLLRMAANQRGTLRDCVILSVLATEWKEGDID